MKEGELTKAHCNTCSGKTNHSVLYRDKKIWKEQIGEEPHEYIHGEDRYELLKCEGCGSVQYCHTNLFSEATDDQGRLIPTITSYPPATFRRPPKWLSSGLNLSSGKDIVIVWLPEFLTRMLGEIYIALHNDCRALAVMGVRALLERTMIDRVGDQGRFVDNLIAFQQQGFIAQIQRETLEATLEVGHASIHRNYNPSKQDLEHVLDIAENILEAVYINGPRADQLRKRTPPRPKRN